MKNENNSSLMNSTEENPEYMEKYFSFNKIGMFVVDLPEGKIIDCNKTILKLLNYKKIEIIGKKIDKYIKFKGIFDNKLEWKSISAGEAELAAAENRTLKRNLQIIKLNDKTGAQKNLLIILKESTNKETLKEDKPSYNHELEILRERELKYRTLIEQSFDGIALINHEGNIIIWNSRLLDMLGYSREDILHTNLKETFSGEVKELTERQNASHGSSRTLSFESRIIRKNGSHFPAEINIRLLENDMIMLAVRDITEKKAAEEMREKLFNKLIEAQNVMKTLSRKLIQVQEMERRNIARELHDEIGQTLTAIKIDIMNAMKNISADGQSQLKDTIQLVEGTLNNVRELSLQLRPSILDDLGLIPAVRWYIDRQVQRTGINAKVITKQPEIKLSAEFQIASYRIIQEAVNNIMKHSQAKNMAIEIDARENELHVTITDDGKGYDVIAARKNAAGGVSVGVLGMQERAELVGGWMDIYSKPGKGTTIHAIFPYRQNI